MRFYNDTDHRQCAAVDDHGLDCAAPEGHEPPHANVNGEWAHDRHDSDCLNAGGICCPEAAGYGDEQCMDCECCTRRQCSLKYCSGRCPCTSD